MNAVPGLYKGIEFDAGTIEAAKLWSSDCLFVRVVSVHLPHHSQVSVIHGSGVANPRIRKRREVVRERSSFAGCVVTVKEAIPVHGRITSICDSNHSIDADHTRQCRDMPDSTQSSNSAHRTGLQNDRLHTSTATVSGKEARRPSPLALQDSQYTRSASHVPNFSSPTANRAPRSQDVVPIASPTLPVERVRAPNPAKRAVGNPELDEIRAAATADAVKEAANKASVTNNQTASRNVSACQVLAAAPQLSTSPPTSPTMSSNSKTIRVDPRPIMARTASIDSTVSSISSSTAATNKANGGHGYKVSQDSNAPQDVASAIAAAGSPEAAIEKLIAEKNTAASHNAQLWRLVEKQRAMILGLNKDLEKSLKEKERYRRKLKDSMVQSASAPVLPTGTHQADDLVSRDDSQSPALPERLQDPPLTAALRDFGLDSRKVSDASELGLGRSDTPQDSSAVPSSVLPGTPQSATSIIVPPRCLDRANSLHANPLASHPVEIPMQVQSQRYPASTPPISPRLLDAPTSPKSPVVVSGAHKKSISVSTTAMSPPHSAQSFSSVKPASRKAPPAPLKLSPTATSPTVTNNIIDASESEYEEDPNSARAEQMERGRRKTREEDDRERERSALARQEEEVTRSRSKKDKKSISKSQSQPAKEKSETSAEWPVPTLVKPAVSKAPVEQRPKMSEFQALSDPAAIIRQRAASDAAGMLQRKISAPPMMSPGLPMSPRPTDRPLNSPMPRAPKTGASTIPMSPRVGMPLSPRPPRQPLPMVPQTPLTFASPHLTRAEGYHQQAQASQGSIGDRLRPSPNESPDQERPSTSSADPKSPGEVYRGLVTEQYPELLLPPNALPSIFIKTASSRMRPSRISYVPKHAEENPVFILAVHERSDSKQLWRVEKTLDALSDLDRQIKRVCAFRDRAPDKTLFAGHAPAKIDARRAALDTYFDRMLDAVTDERGAKVVCKFLSTDAIGSEGSDYFDKAADTRPDTPLSRQRPRKEGYLTKRGKNFGGWKARFFVLDGPNLKYFEAPGGAHMGSIKLQNAQIGKQSPNANQNSAEDEDNQFRHAFLILEPKRKDSSSLVRHVLCAESDEERDAWVDSLLQYVDYRDEEEDVKQPIQHTKPVDLSGARSPRLQKSMNDLRPPSRGKDTPSARHLDPLRAVGYDQTIAGSAPVIIGPPTARRVESPSPPLDAGFAKAGEQNGVNLPTISAPSNAHVIQNAGDWGMKVPPTPGARDTFVKDKKRSIFSGFRGRSSSDLDPTAKISSPIFPPQDHNTYGVRAVFGVSLAEAVQYAHPADATTELPAVVYRCIEYLTAKRAIAEEGIFRLSGSNTVIKALRDRFNTEGDVNLTAEGKYHDIHAVASLLKLYLRELPSTILTRELHMEFLTCLEMHSRDKVNALNVLVNKLPPANRALLQALSAFLLSIVNNADVNKMNVRNGELKSAPLSYDKDANDSAVGIVFAPTLNVPAPLISSFVEDQSSIFGTPVDEAESPISVHEISAAAPTDLRSPRKQMFTDLPTPAYHQTQFQSLGGMSSREAYDTGFAPMQPTYADYQMAPQGEGGYGSLNDALRSPTVYGTAGNGAPTPRDTKARRRESGMLLVNNGSSAQKKPSMSKLREEEGASF